MPPRYSARQVEAALERLGFAFVRQRGSHRRWRGRWRGMTRNVSVVAGVRQIKPGTFYSIAEQAGLSANELEQLTLGVTIAE